MSYRRPPLVMALGSYGGYYAFGEVMREVDPEASENGIVYFVEHLSRGPLDWLGLRVKGIKLKRVKEGMQLERGNIYLQPGVYDVYERRGSILVLDPDSDGDAPRFVMAKPHEKYMGLSHSISSALEAGYLSDMMIVALSGGGRDGSDALEEITGLRERGAENGGVPHIVIQDWDTAEVSEIPVLMCRKARELRLPHLVLRPGDIGREINRFLSPSSSASTLR